MFSPVDFYSGSCATALSHLQLDLFCYPSLFHLGGCQCYVTVNPLARHSRARTVGDHFYHRHDGKPLATILAVLSAPNRSEEHTSELQSRENLVCRLLLE